MGLLLISNKSEESIHKKLCGKTNILVVDANKKYHEQLSGDGSHVDHVVQNTGQKLAQVVVGVEVEKALPGLCVVKQRFGIAVGTGLVDATYFEKSLLRIIMTEG